jgi:cytochrome oxidase Cu insertion factor (SCO1/SenC/PrrC family)
MPQNKITIVVLAAGTISLFVLGSLLLMRPSNDMPRVVTTGTAQVGGPYSLTTHNGLAVTEKSFLGKPQLVFFGFTYCPDICPLTLDVVGAALDELGSRGEDLQLLFITVDPERDSVAELAEYLTNFNPRITGLTGTLEQINQVTKAYHVYVKKRIDEEAPESYSVDHTGLIYLMGKEGQYLSHFSNIPDATGLAKNIEAQLTKNNL